MPPTLFFRCERWCEMRNVSKRASAAKMTMVSVLVATDLWERVNAVAQRRRETVGQLVQRALTKEVDGAARSRTSRAAAGNRAPGATRASPRDAPARRPNQGGRRSPRDGDYGAAPLPRRRGLRRAGTSDARSAVLVAGGAVDPVRAGVRE